MNSPDLTVRPCEAHQAPRRADCVCKVRGHRPQAAVSRSSRPAPCGLSPVASPAFSLVELTIVLAIVVIVSSLALPRYWSSVARYRVDLAARRLAADLNLAQTHARTTGQFRNVVFSPGTAIYVLSEETAFNGGNGAQTVDLNADPYLISFGSISATDGGRRVTFDGFGQPAQGLTVTLLSSGHQRTVSVDQNSGSINVTTP